MIYIQENRMRNIHTQIDYYNQTAHEILTKDISLMLPKFPKDRNEKRSIISSLVTIVTSVAYEGISSYLHNRGQKAFMTMENKVNLE